MKAKIIVLAGQSNAVGVAHVRYLPKHFSAERLARFENGYDDILINYYSHDKKSGGFVKTAYGCTEISKDTVGPEVGIADSLSLRYPDEKLFIVKCAFGGTDIAHDWASPSRTEVYDSLSFGDGDSENEHYRKAGWCYNELVKLMGESIYILKKKGYAPEIRAFCWMQGESDAMDKQKVTTYTERYKMLLSDFESVFGEYMSGCVFIDAAISEQWTYYKELNTQKLEYAANTPNSFFIDTIAHGLVTTNEPEGEVDFAHYDSDCIIKLGELFAEKIQL